MVRTFTKDLGQNFRKGDVKDYPHRTWDTIAKAAGKSLDSFSEPVQVAGNINDKRGKKWR